MHKVVGGAVADLDELMRRVREEVRATGGSRDDERPAALVSAPGKYQPALAKRRPLRERLDPRKLIHRLLGIRDLVKLSQKLKSTQHGPMALAALPNVVNDLKSVVEGVRVQVGDVREQLEDVVAQVGDVRTQIKRFPEIQTELSRAQFKITDSWRHIADQARRLDILIAETRRRLPEPLHREQLQTFADEGEKQLSALYVSFEDRYRGTREDIMRRQSVYLPQVLAAADATGGATFVDIGCGRGEFLELLRNNGLIGRGLDMNPVMIAECRQRGLEVAEGDARNYLRELPADSLAGVSGFHIIEHVPFDVLIDLFDEALRALAPGGVLIFETPNPANLLVAAERFYMDPTHRNPLPSEMVSFMAEARGFDRVDVLPLHPVSHQRRDYDDPMLGLLQDKLYGPQDYGLVAWKAK